jgi:hypothetical protein
MRIRPVERLTLRAILVAALLTFFALALGAASAKSPTNDEPIHLTRGVALGQSGDLSLQFEHAPLSHRLIGALLPTEPTLPLVADLQARPSGDRPAIARELLWESGVNVDRILFLGRLPIVWTGLLLGAIIALWVSAATRHFAPASAVVMALYATSPNLLASAALATTDFVAAATYFATICGWWFYCRRPGRARWLMTGAMLGLALAAKLTGVLLIPLLIVLAYVYPWRSPWWRPTARALSLLPVAAVVLWAVYAFQVGPWRGVMTPAPAYWESWASVLTHVTEGHPAFFLGRLSASGWWLYFPVTFLIKTPVVFLGLLIAALVWIVRDRESRRVAAFTLLPAAALFAAAIASRLNIGYRHILPMLPFLLITIGLVVPALWSRPAARWGLGLAMVWTAVAALRQHPHHLAYFNEIVGGSPQGYRYLGDSNLDWGQDLKALAAHAAADEGLFVSYGGAADPAYYSLTRPSPAGPDGAGSADFHPANPAPGHYAISAGHVQGLLPEADLYDWFRRRRPDGTIGYSILLYDVAGAQPGDWIAQCLAPGPLLAAEAAEQLVGVSGARHLVFDCESAWVFPDGGAPGWYVLPIRDEPWWIAGRLGVEPPAPVYHHRANQFGPDYEVYYWPGGVAPAGLLGEPVAAPTSVGPAALQSYAANGSEWLTLWRVDEITAEPLSMQAHLYAGDGPPQVADGLGFSSDQWRPGDWFIQRHTFAAPGDSLETGLYNYVTLEPASETVRLPAP